MFHFSTENRANILLLHRWFIFKTYNKIKIVFKIEFAFFCTWNIKTRWFKIKKKGKKERKKKVEKPLWRELKDLSSDMPFDPCCHIRFLRGLAQSERIYDKDLSPREQIDLSQRFSKISLDLLIILVDTFPLVHCIDVYLCMHKRFINFLILSHGIKVIHKCTGTEQTLLHTIAHYSTFAGVKSIREYV